MKNKISSKLKSCSYYVEGMHCASCEVLIEKKLLKQNGIEAVDASLSSGKVEITYSSKIQPTLKDLNSNIEQYGYKLSETEIKKDKSALINIENGSISIDKNKVKKLLNILIAVVIIIIAFFIFENLQLGQHISVDANSSLPAFFVLGIVAGLSSCAALVGGLLLSMTKQWNELYIDSESRIERAGPHIMFHSGRIIAFTIFGGLLGLVGQLISFNNATFFSILTLVVCVVMLILGLQMLGVSWAQKFQFRLPKLLSHYVADEKNFSGKYMPFLLGALTFILPCGFTLVAQTLALASGSFIKGALIMLLFALGTLPVLATISFSGLAFNSRPQLTAKFNIAAGLVIIFFVVYNVNSQMNVLGLPSLSDINFSAEDNLNPLLATENNGEQVLNITAQGFAYIANGTTTLKAGVPAKLIIDNQGIQGCGSFMAAVGLIDNYIQLKPGINEVDLGKPQKGTYKLTCTMGMVPPVIINVI